LPGNSGIFHSVLFIASGTDGHLTPEFTWTKNSESEAGSEVLRFVDQADLFGDGQPEVRRDSHVHEDYQFRIYRRTKDGSHWEQVFETELNGCA
jgi:hypothetical protein